MIKKRVLFLLIFLLAGTALAVVLYFPRKTEQKARVAKQKARVAKKNPVVVVTPENPYLQQLISDYEKVMEEMMEHSTTPGVAIAIVKDSTVIYLRGFGLRAMGTTDSVDTETVFRLASVSKCFAPVLTGILVDEHLLSWDEQVIHYVPDFSLSSREQTEKVNLRHVLSHTMGLPYHTYTNLVEDGADLHDMLFKLREVNMINKVGTVYSYQNVAYSLVSEVVHAATGKTYEEEITERIFIPLHMDQASISYDAIMHNTNVALPHLQTRHGLSIIPISRTYYNVSPAGGVNASISDMSRWLTALLGHRPGVVSNQTLNEIFTPFIKAPLKNRNFRKWIRPTGSGYALGWRTLNFKSDTLFYHGGYVNGYRSELAVDRKGQIGICVLVNSPGDLIDNSVPHFYNLYLNYRDSIQQWDNEHHVRKDMTAQP